MLSLFQYTLTLLLSAFYTEYFVRIEKLFQFSVIINSTKVVKHEIKMEKSKQNAK